MSGPFVRVIGAASKLNDCSGALATGAGQLCPSNENRRGFAIQNQHASASIWVSDSPLVQAGQPGFEVYAGTLFEWPTTILPSGPIYYFTATASHPVAVRER